jgi:hypothetical protein
VSGEEEDVVKLLSQARAKNDNNNTITSEDSLKENLKEIEKMIEDAGETRMMRMHRRGHPRTQSGSNGTMTRTEAGG